MKLIVGLGNPGNQYTLTRHNVGFDFLDYVASLFQLNWKSENKFKALTSRGQIFGCDVVLFKPQTYMNLSGESVGPFVRFNKLPLSNIIAVFDDIDMPPLKVKIRQGGGGHGGHNGIRNMMLHLDGSSDFPKLKIGVGKPPPEIPMDVSDWVLARFSPEERQQLEATVFKEALDRLQTLVLS